jgi:hypothetical protein
MVLKTECIGKVFKVKAKNGLTLNIEIENDLRKFEFYQKMNLDVFAPAKKAVISEVEIVDKPKKKVKDATKEGDE